MARTVRSLTKAQATVLLTLLDSGPETERQRERDSGLPRTTYQDAKRRIYSERYLEDRYLPHPRLLGVRNVNIRLDRPFADALASEARAWALDPAAAVVWQGTQAAFGVFFELATAVRPVANRVGTKGGPAPGETPPSSSSGPAAPLGPQPGRSFRLEVDPSSFGLPVYFDYEGALSRLTGLWVPKGYPHPLGGPLEEGYARRLPARVRRHPEVLRELVRRPFSAEAGTRPGHLLGPPSLPRTQRQLVLSGAVEWRPFPSVERLPGYGGRALEGVAFVHGTLRNGARPADLFRALVAGHGTHPFLFATDGLRLLFATLTVRDDRPGPSGGASREAGSVLESLRGFLTEIDILRESITSLRVLVNHRYDRFVSADGPGPAMR